LTIETNDLQMTVRVRADFRFIAAFENGTETPATASLIATDEQSWGPIAKDGQQLLWKRRNHAKALAQVPRALRGAVAGLVIGQGGHGGASRAGRSGVRHDPGGVYSLSAAR